MVGSLKLDDTRPDTGRGFIELKRERGEGNGSGGMVIEGEFQVEEDEVTAIGCGLRLSVGPFRSPFLDLSSSALWARVSGAYSHQWSLQVQVRWKKLDSPMVISQLIHLPHYSAN